MLISIPDAEYGLLSFINRAPSGINARSIQIQLIEDVQYVLAMSVNDTVHFRPSFVPAVHPITKRYLWSEWEDGVLTGGRIEYVRIMGVIGLLILLIAAINFTNLATARSAQRAMEIGIRKTFGGSRKGLAGQFLFESVFTAFVSFMVALGAVWLLLGSFNALTEKSISLLQVSASTWLLFIGITGFTGLLAGIYPALFLSGFGIMKVLRARSVGGAGSGNLRRALVVFQFGVSIVLIVGTMTIYNQMSLIRTQNLGFSRENVVSARLEGGARECILYLIQEHLLLDQ